MVMVAEHSQSRDFFFDLVFVSGVFGKYAKKSKPVRLSIASMVVAVGAVLEEFVSTRYAHPTAALISPSLEKLHFIRHFQ